MDGEKFRVVDGRRYVNAENTNYFIPNDEAEDSRLYAQHLVFKHYWNGNFISPVDSTLKKEGAKVLDAGCGSGVWAVDMGFTYPNATVVGIDIAPNFMTNRPENVEFRETNLLEGIPYPDNHFDFVHARLMSGCYSLAQWEAGLKEMWRVTKPGGWVESCEFDADLIGQGAAAQRLNGLFRNFLDSQGLQQHADETMPGFFDKLPDKADYQRQQKDMLADTNGKYSIMFRDDLADFYGLLKLPLIGHASMNGDEYDALVEAFKRECDTHPSGLHSYRFIARKREA